jgi:ribokinase
MSILVLGSINTDLVIRGPRLPVPAETVIGGTFYQVPGGKGANQAVAAARLARSPVTFVAAVGDDAYGAAAREALARENLRTEFIRTVPDEASGVALILVDRHGQNLISVASGANLRLLPEDIEALPGQVFRESRVFLASLETPLETVIFGLERAKRAGLATILNPAPADRALCGPSRLALVDVLVPNEHEAAELAGRAVDSPDSAVEAAWALRRLGARAVIVTLGARGAVVVDEEVTLVPAEPVQAVDTTAAGDCYCGALAVALAEGWPLAAAARWAGRAAALSVGKRGAQPSLPTRAEVGELSGD